MGREVTSHMSKSTKLRQIKAIKNGKGIQYIINEAYKILENPILIHDMEYKLVVSPDGAISDDCIWNEFMISGKLCDETIEFCKNESFIDSVANCTNFDGVTYLISDKLKYNRIFGQLYTNNNMPVADLVMMACDKPFEDDTPELIETLCKVLSKELSQCKYYQDYAQTYQEALIRKLIEGDIEDKGLYSSHVSNINSGLKTNIFLAVADLAQNGSAHATLVYFRDLFKRTQPAFKYSIYADYIVILASSDYAVLNVKKDLNKLNKLFKQQNIYAGISSNFENLYEMQIYYTEAVNALNNGSKSNNDQRIFLYDEIIKVSK